MLLGVFFLKAADRGTYTKFFFECTLSFTNIVVQLYLEFNQLYKRQIRHCCVDPTMVLSPLQVGPTTYPLLYKALIALRKIEEVETAIKKEIKNPQHRYIQPSNVCPI